jgi:hypothetical protein
LQTALIVFQFLIDWRAIALAIFLKQLKPFYSGVFRKKKDNRLNHFIFLRQLSKKFSKKSTNSRVVRAFCVLGI